MDALRDAAFPVRLQASDVTLGDARPEQFGHHRTTPLGEIGIGLVTPCSLTRAALAFDLMESWSWVMADMHGLQYIGKRIIMEG